MGKKFEYRVLNLAGDMGEALLENGSEVYRVENSVCAVAENFRYRAQCFATLTCIIITFETSDMETISLVRRIKNRGVNLNKVHEVYSLMKNIENYDIDGLEISLDKIRYENPYTFYINALGSAIVSSFFAILFLGSHSDFIVSLILGIVVALFSKVSDTLNLGIFFSNLICGLIVTVLSSFFVYLGVIDDPSVSTISALMLLVPGVAFINSIRDIFAGDLVTGMSRLMEVAMIGTSIAVGSAVGLKMYISLGGI